MTTTHTVRWVVGLFTLATMVMTIVAGYGAYITSRESMERAAIRDSRAVVQSFRDYSDGRDGSTREQILSGLESAWSTSHGAESGYMCVYDNSGRLTLHTATPGRVGLDVGNMAIMSADSTTLRDLVRAKQDYVGPFISDEGEEQLVAFSYSSALDSIIAVHLPFSAITAKVQSTAIPWIVALMFIAGVLLPLSNLVAYRVFARSQGQLTAAFARLEQDALRRADQEKRLRRSEKMEALGKLTGGVAHDFNNLMAIVVGYTELLERDLDTSATEEREFTREILSAAQRGAALTNRLLSFSRQTTEGAVAVDLNARLTQQRLMLDKVLTARVVLTLDLDDALWPVRLVPGEFDNAVLNMCINALHAMRGSGALQLRTQNVSVEAAQARVLDVPSADYVLVTVTDDGEGMDDATCARVFEPFFTTKGQDGTGLGLSQVYGLMERSNGSVSVVSAPGQGTTFFMYFPRSLERIEVGPAPMTSLGQRGSETILVVDDEPVIVRMINQVLSRRGYDVLTAPGGEEALQVLATRPVDLLISDVIMPGMDGFELASQVRVRHPQVAILMVSGFVDYGERQTIDQDLVQNILSKPFSSESLLAAARRCLDLRRAAEATAER